jgi:hypothetical protein
MGVMVDLYCNSYATPPAVVTLGSLGTRHRGE